MFNKLLLTDTSGKKSTTLTAFMIGFVVVNLKLLFSGMTINGLILSPFSGGEYASALIALGGIYVIRRATNKEKSDE